MTRLDCRESMRIDQGFRVSPYRAALPILLHNLFVAALVFRTGTEKTPSPAQENLPPADGW